MSGCCGVHKGEAIFLSFLQIASFSEIFQGEMNMVHCVAGKATKMQSF